MSRKNKNNKTTTDTSEHIAVYHSQVEFMKLAIHCMLIANGGAISTVLIKFNDSKMFYPLLIFSFGVAYTILVPIRMYIKAKDKLEVSQKKQISPFDKKIHNRLYNFIIETFTVLIIYMPVLFFIYGVFAAEEIILNGQILSPLEIIRKLVILLKSMVICQ